MRPSRPLPPAQTIHCWVPACKLSLSEERSMKMQYGVMACAASLMVAGLLAGCGSGSSTASNGTTGSTTTSTGGATGGGKKELEIAVIPKGTTHEYWKSIHAGADAAAKELGG